MNIDYCLFNPNKNITVLVTTPTDIELQPTVAAELMKIEPTCEQVGFVKGDSLRMAGGEFCGNATVCCAAYICIKNGYENKTHLNLTVSGAPKKVEVRIEKSGENAFDAAVLMPKPIYIKKVVLPLPDGSMQSLDAVGFDGITHIIFTKSLFSKDLIANAAKNWADLLGVDALGVMFTDFSVSKVTPLVYVKKSGTMVWESSCASGTAALGAYLYGKTEAPFKKYFEFPGGFLGAEVDSKENLILHGSAELLRFSKTEIPDFTHKP